MKFVAQWVIWGALAFVAGLPTLVKSEQPDFGQTLAYLKSKLTFWNGNIQVDSTQILLWTELQQSFSVTLVPLSKVNIKVSKSTTYVPGKESLLVTFECKNLAKCLPPLCTGEANFSTLATCSKNAEQGAFQDRVIQNYGDSGSLRDARRLANALKHAVSLRGSQIWVVDLTSETVDGSMFD